MSGLGHFAQPRRGFLLVDVRFAPKATENVHRRDLARRARSRHQASPAPPTIFECPFSTSPEKNGLSQREIVEASI
jgi:hypothetical protein